MRDLVRRKLQEFTQNQWQFRPARPEDADTVYALYQSLLGTPFCPWDADYPARQNVDDDIAAGALYVLYDGAQLAAAGCARHWQEHDGVAPWTCKRPCDLLRIGVARERQNQGVGAAFLYLLATAARDKGFDGMRILVARTNLPARSLYDRMGAIYRGSTFDYNIDWVCCELDIESLNRAHP